MRGVVVAREEIVRSHIAYKYSLWRLRAVLISSFRSATVSKIRRLQGILRGLKMDLRYHAADFREVRILVSCTQSARSVRAGQRPVAAIGKSRCLTDVPLAALVVSVPAIAAGIPVVVVIKQVHIMVKICR